MIEQCGLGAAEALAAIHAAAFPRGWKGEEFATLMANPAAFALVDSDGRGFVLAWAAGGESEILTLAVRQGARRCGLGFALVTTAARLALARGAGSMHLEVAEGNEAARALYAKLGFTETAKRPGYYAGGAANAVVMARALPM